MRWCGEQQSLAFSAPVPAFVYQNVFFEAAVGLVDDHRSRITGCVCAGGGDSLWTAV